MHLHNFYAVICGLCSMVIGINAYPHFFGSTLVKYKKSDLGFPQTDADVLELESLKHNQNDENVEVFSHQQETNDSGSGITSIARAADGLISHDNLLPELERQLESAAAAIPMITAAPSTVALASVAGQAEQEQTEQVAHRPPMLQHQDGGKMAHGSEGGSLTAPPTMAKPFYGAARLAFGQNPEVLPTSSTSTTTTTTVASTSITDNVQSSESIITAPEVNAAPTVQGEHLLRPQTSDQAPPSAVEPDADEHTKETIADVVAELDTFKSAERRSVPLTMSPKTAESLLRHRGGQYSSFDMAQYVFWTGDEAGVARAVEEFIEQGLMTREAALHFLRDIRLGIEYLQRSYTNRVFPDEEMRPNNIKKSYQPSTTTTTHPPSTTTTTTTTTETPFPKNQHLNIDRGIGQQVNVPLTNTFNSVSMWNKLQELNEDGKHDLNDYDEATGRAKIAEFLYTEYTLEEILYKLAKVMFTQSLAHSSNEAQQQLQKLTDFLEREGNLGVIPIDLQKKVLHVLLSALSDTLSEHPELLSAARSNLANPYNRLPMHTYGSID